MFSKRLLLPLLCFLISGSVNAQVPYTFSAGTVAKAEEVNADFTALVNQINQLQAQIAELSGTQTTITVAGTYDIFRLGVDVDDNGNGSYGVAGSSFSGTLTLNSDGSGTFSTSENYRGLSITTVTNHNNTINTDLESTTIQLNNSPSSANGNVTWTQSGNQITVTPSGDNPVTFVVSGKTAVGIENAEGTAAIYVALKR